MKKFNRSALNFLYNEKKSGNESIAAGTFKLLLKLPLILLSFGVIAYTKIRRSILSNPFALKNRSAGVFTISLGNINMGGSGKTPLSLALSERLYGIGLKPCIVTRGYKGRLKKKSI